MTEIKCNVHRTYKAKFPPRPTKRNPNGCAACWQIYHEKLTERIDRLEQEQLEHRRQWYNFLSGDSI